MGLPQRERHAVHRVGWLRATVLGANDGLVSTASLIVGVAAAGAGGREILVAGLAGLTAGAMSMAAGEYVSVSSQADTEAADLARETQELRDTPELELEELTATFVARGVSAGTARAVAEELTAYDALAAHAREELGIHELTTARPLQAAAASAASFSVGAALPLATALLAPEGRAVHWVVPATLVFLAVLGSLGASVGGARVLRPALRVTFWGAFAMAVTAGVGALFGVAV